ncbi:MAG: PilZ domain-containing protein [Acidobacteriota bacterium]
MFVPGQIRVRAGQVVLLEIVLEQEENVLRTAGIVRWIRTKADNRLACGVGVEFAPGIPLTTRMKPLVETLPTGLDDLRRGSRYPVALDAAYQVLGITLQRNLVDVSKTGGFLETDIPPSVGMIFPVTLAQGVSQPLELTVASVRRELDREANRVRGIGFQFVTHTPREQQVISRIMANVAVRHMEKRQT